MYSKGEVLRRHNDQTRLANLSLTNPFPTVLAEGVRHDDGLLAPVLAWLNAKRARLIPPRTPAVSPPGGFHIKQFAYLLGKLKSTPDGDGTLLDHVMITYGSGLSDGHAHDHADLPLVLAGRGGGTLKPDRLVRHPKETPMANLFVAMLDRMGVPVESLGDSQGHLGYLSNI